MRFARIQKITLQATVLEAVVHLYFLFTCLKSSMVDNLLVSQSWLGACSIPGKFIIFRLGLFPSQDESVWQAVSDYHQIDGPDLLRQGSPDQDWPAHLS
jgi:hypothetical protein